jgi:hypothetical protein
LPQPDSSFAAASWRQILAVFLVGPDPLSQKVDDSSALDAVDDSFW